jgi:hypothetical protein
MATLRDKREPIIFLGLFKRYRRYISSLDNTQAAEQIQKGESFQRSPEVGAAFKSLKEAVCASHIVRYPQPGEKFFVDTVARNVGYGVFSPVNCGQEPTTLKPRTGQKKILRYTAGICDHREGFGTLSLVPLRTIIPPLLGPSHHSERLTELPRCRTDSSSRGRTLPGMERESQQRPHMQGLLGSM